MSYTPTNWSTGDTITAEKLNKLEQGVASGGSGGGVLVVTLDMQTLALDKTWQEIYDSAFAVITENAEEGEKAWITVHYAYAHDAIYEVDAFAPGPGTSVYFVADSADGYPVMQQDGGD